MNTMNITGDRRVTGMTGLAAVAAIALAAGQTGCAAKGDATVDGVLLAQADGVEDPPEGPTLAVDEKTIDAAVVPAGA
jgi:hypothetical protein